MSSKIPQDDGPSTPPQSIPLRDLSRPPDSAGGAGESRLNSRGRSLLSVGGGRPSSGYGISKYQRIGDASPSPTGRQIPSQMDPVPLYSISSPPNEAEPHSPVENPAEFQSAMGFAGLSVQMDTPPAPVFARPLNYGSPPQDYEDITAGLHPYRSSSDDSQPYFPSQDSDRIPLTDPHYLQPLSGTQASSSGTQLEDRSSFQTVRFNTPDSKPRGARLGDDLLRLETGVGQHNYDGSRGSISPGGSGGPRLSRALSVNSPLGRAGSIMRAVSQRVVNLGNEPEVIESSIRRQESNRRQSRYDGPRPQFVGGQNAFGGEPSAAEKAHAMNFGPPIRHRMPNPLKGKSLGIFGPENILRKRLCDLLVHPVTEPTLLVLIIIQTIMLAVEASSNVYDNPRPQRWGDSRNDYFLFGLFLIYTAELFVRVIVSGFLFNPQEHSTIDRKRGLKGAVLDKYGTVFGPHRVPSTKGNVPNGPQPFAPAVARGFNAMQNKSNTPSTAEDMQRLQLSRRAFLRHSFNRLDFVAIVSFWISFVLQVKGVEAEKHLYIFRMMSCLRILRLTALTSGTSIILRSLKKATPSLLNVSFLIGFFWLIFAIIGVQSFKSSLKRTCVWQDPLGKQPNFTNNLTFCGGHLNNVTGVPEPWIYANGTNGTTKPKGYLCPRNSFCTESQNPYNGTISFDNIAQSIEMVFVIMTANTFSDIMYYTTNSDYLAAAIFTAFGIVIMTLWLMNLLIAVITSSFQVIREENKTSAFTRNEGIAAPEPSKRRLSTVQKVYDKTFWFWIAVIITGLLAQTAKSATMSDRRSNAIFAVEIVVTLLLVVELCIRFAVDWRVFHRNKYNWVDLFLCISTCVILLPPISNSGQAYNWLSIFQIMRIYRVILGIPMIRGLILKVLGNATGIGNLMLFVFLMNFLVAIFAVQLFRGDVPQEDPDGNFQRGTFATIWNSFIAMYQILSSENWTAVMYEVTSVDNHLDIAWIGAVFFIGWFILSNFILLNMFIAVIQENFDVSEDEKRLQQVKAFLQRKELGGSGSSNLSLSTLFTLGKKKKKKDPLDYGPATMEMLLKDAVVKDFLDEEMDTANLQATQSDANTADVEPGVLSSKWGKFVGKIWSREPNPFYSNIRFVEEQRGMDARAMAKVAVSATAQRKRAQREYVAKHPTYNNALFIFSPTNPIRRFCQRMVGPGRGAERFDGVEPSKAVWYSFSAFIYLSIVCMVLLACITTPLYQKEYIAEHGPSVHSWFTWVDMGFAVIFTAEALIKTIADGLFWTPNAYLRSSWGFIDTLVLITLWINIATSLTNNGGIARAVGAFKALRALRLLNVSDSAKDTFHSVIIVGGSKVLSAAFVSLSLLVPFAIYGLNLFNGKLQSCNDMSGAVVNLSDCTGEYNSSPFNNDWNVLAPRQVSNPYFDFDNFGGALFILFQIVSQEGWVDVMWSTIAITSKGIQPIENTSQGNAVFFIVFNLMATVFVLTLFLSVFMRNYTEQTGVAFLTADQRSWVELRKLLYRVSPSKRPHAGSSDKFKNWCYRQATKKHGPWHRSITVLLVCHLGLLMVEYYPEPYWWSRTRDYIFLLFTLCYIANIGVRIVGLSWPRFSKSSWDMFSLGAVFGTLVTTVLLLTDMESDTYVQLHKLFLVSIVLLLIPRNDALDQLFKTAAASFANIGNLVATWFVLFLVWAIALTQTFGLTRFGSNENNNVNFRTVPKALILLFRMSMGEGWNAVMEDFATITPPMCVIGSSFFDSDCGSASWARALFILWNLVSMYIFVSLFVSLIYESFSYVYQRSSGLSSLSREELRRFKEAWALFDPQGTGFITKTQFPRLLGELSGSFRMRIYEDKDSVRRILDDVRAESAIGRTNSTVSTSSLAGIDLEVLNERLSRINVQKVQERRHRFNLFYEEVLVSADLDRGISFTSVLMILAHYNVISDSKSLRLEEFLRRRARLQRVEEEARRRVVVGFFDTMYWTRRFVKYMTRHDSARLTNVPQFAVPEIFVNDDGEPSKKQPAVTVAPLLSPNDISDNRTSWNDGTSPSPAEGTNLHHRRRGTGGTIGSPRSPTAGSPISQSYASPQLSPNHPSYPPAQRVDGQEEPGSASSSRRGSAVSAENVLEVLDNSVWGESIRRSFTTRRPRTGSS